MSLTGVLGFRRWLGKLREYRLRRFIRSESRILARLGAMDVRVLNYIQKLEERVDSQARELDKLRKAQANARLVELETRQDSREWAEKEGLDPDKARRLLRDLRLESKDATPEGESGWVRAPVGSPPST